MDEGLASAFRTRLAASFSGPFASEGVTDWSGLSLGTASGDHADATMEDSAPLPIATPVGSTPPRSPTLPTVAPPSPLLPPLPGASGCDDVSDLTPEELRTLEQLQGQFSNLRVRRLIDEGASSKVWEGDWAGARVVIKVLREEEALRSFLGEVNIWRQLRHPCVCSLLGVCMFEQRPAMVLEYLAGGSLHDLLHNPTEEQAQLDALLLGRVVLEVASGVAYLHYNGVMHRDIKTANVLLDEARHAKVRLLCPYP